MDLRLLTRERFRLPTLAEWREYWRRLPRNVRRRVFDALAILVVGFVLLLVYRHLVSGPGIPPGARVVRFPEDYSLGTLSTRYWGEDERAGHLGRARGKVVVPAGRELVLFARFEPAQRRSFWRALLRRFGFNVRDTEIVQGSFADLADLGRRDLQGLVTSYSVRDSDMKYIGRMTSLRTLEMSRSRITDEGAQHLARLTSLRKLDLSESRSFGNGALVHLKACRSLQFLDLSRTQVGDAGLAHLAELTSLTTLNLSGTRITDRGLTHLSGLRSLTTLRLSQNKVRGEALLSLHDLPTLQHLELANTLFDKDDARYLAGFNALRYLDLRWDRIHDEGLKPLGDLKSLRHLDLRSTTWVTDEGIRELQRTLPRCIINY